MGDKLDQFTNVRLIFGGDAAPKVIFAKLGRRCEAFLDERGGYAALNANCAYAPSGPTSLEFLVGYVHTSLFHFFYEQFFGALRMSGGYLQFQAPQLRCIPVAGGAADDQVVTAAVSRLLNSKEETTAFESLCQIDSALMEAFGIHASDRLTIRRMALGHLPEWVAKDERPDGWLSFYLTHTASETYDDWTARRAAEAQSAIGPLRALIAAGESGSVEFKQSLEYVDPEHPDLLKVPETYRSAEHKKAQAGVVHSALKTICAFRNSAQGGTLLLGVHDNGTLIGLAPDYDMCKKPDKDGFENKLTDLIKTRLKPLITDLEVKVIAIDGVEVCQLTIPPGPPTYLDNELFIRLGNSTEKLSGRDLEDWLRSRGGQ